MRRVGARKVSCRKMRPGRNAAKRTERQQRLRVVQQRRQRPPEPGASEEEDPDAGDIVGPNREVRGPLLEMLRALAEQAVDEDDASSTSSSSSSSSSSSGGSESADSRSDVSEGSVIDDGDDDSPLYSGLLTDDEASDAVRPEDKATSSSHID